MYVIRSGRQEWVCDTVEAVAAKLAASGFSAQGVSSAIMVLGLTPRPTRIDITQGYIEIAPA